MVTIATGQSGSSAAVKGGFAKIGFALAMAVPIGFLARRRRRGRNLLLLGLVVTLIGCGLGLTGCGLGVKPGSGSSTTTTPPLASTYPTPPGSYTLSVTGTAPGLSHSVQLTLTVE
jgi:disulfide bond formation protein DsbB